MADLFGTDLAVVPGLVAHDASQVDVRVDSRAARPGEKAGPTELIAKQLLLG